MATNHHEQLKQGLKRAHNYLVANQRRLLACSTEEERAAVFAEIAEQKARSLAEEAAHRAKRALTKGGRR